MQFLLDIGWTGIQSGWDSQLILKFILLVLSHFCCFLSQLTTPKHAWTCPLQDRYYSATRSSQEQICSGTTFSKTNLQYAWQLVWERLFHTNSTYIPSGILSEGGWWSSSDMSPSLQIWLSIQCVTCHPACWTHSQTSPPTYWPLDWNGANVMKSIYWVHWCH